MVKKATTRPSAGKTSDKISIKKEFNKSHPSNFLKSTKMYPYDKDDGVEGRLQ